MTRSRRALTAMWVVSIVAAIAGASCSAAAAGFLGELLAAPPPESPVTSMIPQAEIERLNGLRETFSAFGQWLLAAAVLIVPLALAVHTLHWDDAQGAERQDAGG